MLTKVLKSRGAPIAVKGVQLRQYRGVEDIDLWLQTRLNTFADEFAPPKPWTHDNWKREFASKPWWQPERMWFATVHPPLCRTADEGKTVGTVTLGLRGKGILARPTIHWLMVTPEWRWSGIGRFMVTQVEQQAYEMGHREIVLETLSEWGAATAFYQKLNYEPHERDDERPEV